MRRYRRWSYALRRAIPKGANPAQGNRDSMPQNRASAKSRPCRPVLCDTGGRAVRGSRSAATLIAWLFKLPTLSS